MSGQRTDAMGRAARTSSGEISVRVRFVAAPGGESRRQAQPAQLEQVPTWSHTAPGYEPE